MLAIPCEVEAEDGEWGWIEGGLFRIVIGIGIGNWARTRTGCGGVGWLVLWTWRVTIE